MEVEVVAGEFAAPEPDGLLVGDEPALVVESSEGPETSALVGSRVPHWLKMLDLHSS